MSNARDVLPASSRYDILVRIAAGGMGTVYVGRSRAGGGVSRLFAIKRAHPHLLADPLLRKLFAEEARLAARIHHPNVVAVQDVEELDDELLLVLDYVEGASLADLRDGLRAAEPQARIAVVSRIVLDACAGLHAAHELRDDDGRPLEIVHRDVSPHNILVGVDGIARVTDFGIAKSRAPVTGVATTSGGLKGKVPYMAPEYVETGRIDRRADLFGLGVVMWESLTGERLFAGISEIETIRLVAQCSVRPPSELVPQIPPALEDVVLRALARSPGDRFADVLAFGEAIERAAIASGLLATQRTVGGLVEQQARPMLAERRASIRASADRGMAFDDTDVAMPAELPTNYAGHARTSTLDKPALPAPLDGDGRMPLSEPVTLLSTAQGVDGLPRPRSSVLVRASLVTLAVATLLGAWAGVRRLTRTEPAPAVAPATSVAVPPALAASPPISAAPPPSGALPATTSAASAPATAARPPRLRPADPSTRPRAPKNPYLDAGATARP